VTTIVVLGTATPGGGFPLYGAAFAETVNQSDPTLVVEPRNTKGSTENIPLLEAGQLDIALVTGEPAYEAFEGIGRARSALKIVTAMYSTAGMFAVASDSPARSIGDLTGKPVAFGARGSGLVILSRYVLDGLCLDQDKDFQAIYLDRAGDGPAMVLDGRAAALWGGGVGWPGFAAVAQADGRFIAGRKFVASAIDFPATVQMAGEELFPAPVREKAKAWHWGNHSLVTLHLALRHAPAYRAAAFDPDIARAYNIFFGMDHIDEVASCFEDCAAKKFPKVLMGNGACNSQFDPTYAPPGQHAAFWWPFAPYSVDGGPQNWERHRADYSERVLEYWRVYASNLGDRNVLGSYLFTPLDVERLNSNMRQGAVRMGAYVPSQLGINRPHPLLPGSRTPVEGLYLCGSSSGNGGGVNGAPGYIAANAIAEDLRLKRPWTPVPPPEWRH